MFDFKKKKFRKKVGTIIRDLGHQGSYLTFNDVPEVAQTISQIFADQIDESFESSIDESKTAYVLITEVMKKLNTDKEQPWKSSFMDAPLYKTEHNWTTSNEGIFVTVKYYFVAAAHKLCDDDSPVSAGMKKDLTKYISQLLPFPVDEDNNSWVHGYKNYFALLENFWALRLSKMDRYLVEFAAGLNLQKIAKVFKQIQSQNDLRKINIDCDKLHKYAADHAILDNKLKEIGISISNEVAFNSVKSKAEVSAIDFYEQIDFDDLEVARKTITQKTIDSFNELDEITRYAFSHHFYWERGFFKHSRIQNLALEAGQALLEESGVDMEELRYSFGKKFPLLTLFRLINLREAINKQVNEDHIQQANDIFSDKS